MASIINLGMSTGIDEEIMNVTATVGARGINLRQDLIIVQALLKYALERLPDFRSVRLPEPTGGDIRATAEIIRKFQRYHNRRNKEKVSTDGRIDPIKGTSPYAHGRGNLWTLYALHLKACEISLLSGSPRPIQAICNRWLVVKTVLENSVGSLGLALE